MPTETKNSTANASCSGNEFDAALWLRSDSLSTMPAKNAPSANETPNSLAAPNAMPTDSARTASVNSSRDPVRAACRSSHGMTRGPTTSAIDAERDHLEQRERERHEDVLPAARHLGAGVAAERFGERRQQHEHQDHREVLDDQPADGDAAVRRRQRSPRSSSALSSTTVLATDRLSPRISAPPSGQPHSIAIAAPIAVAIDDLANRTGDGDPPHGHEVGEREMQADAEHQQDHADLGELSRHRRIGDEAGRVRAHEDAGQQVADERRKPQLARDESEDEREHEPCRKGCDQRDVVRHATP